MSRKRVAGLEEVREKAPEQVRRVRLRTETLDGLPEEIGGWPNLTHLDVSKCSFASFPGARVSHGGLRQLLASHAYITEVSEGIGGFAALEELDLSWNEFVELPEELGELQALRVLNLERTPLVELPEAIGRLTSLVELRLAGCKLRALPEAVGDLECLEVLDLRENGLDEVESVEKSGSLRVLLLGGNRLKGVDLAGLTGLVELDLSGNDLRGISLGGLDGLESLSLASNGALDLEGAAGELGGLEALRELDLSGVAAVEGLVFPRGLRRLRWRHGDFLEVPPGAFAVEELEELDCAYGRVEKVGEAIGSLRRLRVLDLTANALREVPVEVGALEHLECLSLGANHLECVPGALGVLDLSFNGLQGLPEELGEVTSLEEIDLENNRVESAEGLLSALRSAGELRRVRLTGNPITLDVAACEELRRAHPECVWEVNPGKALHRLYQEARRRLATGALEEARARLESIVAFDPMGSGAGQVDFATHRTRLDAEAILRGMEPGAQEGR
jgi:Leucine-rich repeat (LRR) protein